jgi:hypothetical protein
MSPGASWPTPERRGEVLELRWRDWDADYRASRKALFT